ncbi:MULTISPECIES: hypothetical protein [Peribacillus]|uniref:Uncharacterized protein n=1 Tax=Peribacillus simplex TaxID=1478 RepID=A0A9W4KML9_9BACI|nr:hypothetical protein [Peribacillus simplex]WHX89437.1 hypothetical protein QNH50_15385 [Peribacillus simplex]CAH0147838.1 hypothetical protein SRABI133_00636 [Peribacillus simplex]
MIDNPLHKKNDENSAESVEGKAVLNSSIGQSEAPPITPSKDPEFDLFGTVLNGYL